MKDMIYKACSGNAYGEPCLGDLVEQKLLSKRYICDPEGNVDFIEWTNVSDQTFMIEDSFAESGYIELKPGETL